MVLNKWRLLGSLGWNNFILHKGGYGFQGCLGRTLSECVCVFKILMLEPCPQSNGLRRWNLWRRNWWLCPPEWNPSPYKRGQSWFCILPLKSLILSRSFLVEFWESLMYNIISPTNRANLISSVCISLISFSCLTALSSVSSTILRRSGELWTALSCPRF